MNNKISLLIFAFWLGFCFAIYAQEQITLDKIFEQRYFSENDIENITPTKDGAHYTILSEYKSIEKYAWKTGEKVGTLMDLQDTEKDSILYILDYQINSDESMILFSTAVEFIYRHSFVADYYVFDMETGELTKLLDNKIRNAVFSPNGDYISYIFERNLYYYDVSASKHVRITYDGRKNEVINGYPDWVYEEEFGFHQAYRWSPNSKKIAFYRFDERHVKEYILPRYYKDSLYTEMYRYKYPKAGENNAFVEIYCYSLEDSALQQIDIGEEKDQYIPRIKWTKDSAVLAVMRLNRLQNHVEVLFANTLDGISDVVYSEKSSTYIPEINDSYIHFVGEDNNFILRSEKEGYRQLYIYDSTGALINKITDTDYDLDEILGIDEQNNKVYFSAWADSPERTDVFSINFDGNGQKKLSETAGVNTAVFSNAFDYYILSHSTANKPLQVSLHSISGKRIKVLDDNQKLVKKIKEHQFSKVDFFSFKNNEGNDLKGYMIKPRDFSKKKKFPLLLFVYGGPESHEVVDDYGSINPWFQLLVQKGYMVACVDNRGTDGRGNAFRTATYMQLGKLETEDQLAAARYLAGLDYVDDQRMGLFGWSYGGYMTLLCMMKGDGIFKMGISVAPVVNWRFYDTIYTERFMRTPQENPDGYDKNSPIHFVEDLKGKLLIAHGTGDDNVHFQNSLVLINQLIKKNKNYDLLVYPNRQHAIYKDNAHFHLYMEMTKYIEENL